MSKTLVELYQELEQLRKQSRKCHKEIENVIHEMTLKIFDLLREVFPDHELSCRQIISPPELVASKDGHEIVWSPPGPSHGAIFSYHSPGGFFSTLKTFEIGSTLEEIENYIRNGLKHEV